MTDSGPARYTIAEKSDFLTRDEHEIADLLGHVWNLYQKSYSVFDSDNQEFAMAIHQAQNIILSRAAGRLYPGKYRV